MFMAMMRGEEERGAIARRDAEDVGRLVEPGGMAVVRSGSGSVRVTWEGLVEERVGSNRGEAFWRRWRW